MKSNIAIVVPVYNPHAGWHTLLLQRYKELVSENNNYHFFLYLVNDGSTNQIAENEIQLLKENISDFQYFSYTQNQGKGFALRYAIQNIETEYILYTDIDLPFTVESMNCILQEIKTNDIVFGIKQKSYYEQLPWQRKFISKTLQKFIKILFPILPVSDTQCGLKAMNQKGKHVFLNTSINRYLFDLEFILFASKNNLNIKPIPVSLRPGIVFGNMNFKIILHESKNLWKILKKK